MDDRQAVLIFAKPKMNGYHFSSCGTGAETRTMTQFDIVNEKLLVCIFELTVWD